LGFDIFQGINFKLHQASRNFTQSSSHCCARPHVFRIAQHNTAIVTCVSPRSVYCSRSLYKLRNTTLPLSLVSHHALYTAPDRSINSLSCGRRFYFSKFLHPCSTLLICVRHKSEPLNYYVYSSSFSSR